MGHSKYKIRTSVYRYNTLTNLYIITFLTNYLDNNVLHKKAFIFYAPVKEPLPCMTENESFGAVLNDDIACSLQTGKHVFYR